MSGNLEAIFGTQFDPAAVDPADDFDIIPPGKYPVLVEKAEVKRTKAGTGHYIELHLCVIDGTCRGRKIRSCINIDNPSQKATEIGMRELSALGRAIGLVAIQDTAQLLNQCVIAHVKVKDDQNDVRTFSPIQPGTPTKILPPQPMPQPAPQYSQQPPATCPPNQYPPQQPANQAAAGKPPWAR